MMDSTEKLTADAYFEQQMSDSVRKADLDKMKQPVTVEGNEGKKIIYVARPLEPN